MTRREAVIRALRHEETEILPYHLELPAQENDRVAAATGEKDFAAHTGVFLHYMQLLLMDNYCCIDLISM